MAGFDPTLDKELWSESTSVDGMFKLKVSVMSYNDGMPKLQISRERINKEGQASFAKLGRLTVEEIKGILPLLEKGKDFLEQNAPKEE